MIKMEDALTLYFHLTENAIQPNSSLSGIEEYDNETFVVLRSNSILAVFVDLSDEKDVDVNPITGTRIEMLEEEDWPKALKEEVESTRN